MPDTEKVVELSRLFSVTTDYLLLPEQTEVEVPPQAVVPIDPVVERRRKFRIGFGIAAAVLGLLMAVAALVLTQFYAESLTEWWTHLGRFGTALQSWRGMLLAAGIAVMVFGACVLVREYMRKD